MRDEYLAGYVPGALDDIQGPLRLRVFLLVVTLRLIKDFCV